MSQDDDAAARASGDPLHGMTLKAIVETLVEQRGWPWLGEELPLRCFLHEPSVSSSLAFLRRTPWAREKVERLYVKEQRRRKRNARRKWRKARKREHDVASAVARDGVVLRDVVDADVSVFFEHCRDATARHMAAFVSDDPDDRAGFDAHWARLRASDDVLVRAIEVSGVLVGHIASFSRGEDREVTYWVDRTRWGQGIASEALTALLVLDPVRPMHGRVVKDGVGSRRVLEKNGFVICGEDRGFAAGRGADVEEVILRLDDGGRPRSKA